MRSWCVVLAVLLAGCMGGPDGGEIEWERPPQVGFLGDQGTYSNGEPAMVFTVLQVSHGPVLWKDLNLTCVDGTGPEPWGGEHVWASRELAPDDTFHCDGTRLTIFHVPTDARIYEGNYWAPRAEARSGIDRAPAYALASTVGP